MKACEELEVLNIHECKECHCCVGEDWHYVDFSNKTIVECPQCKTLIYLEDEEKELKEINDLDREAIAEQIKQGCTSGILDSEGYRISWNINMNKFKH